MLHVTLMWHLHLLLHFYLLRTTGNFPPALLSPTRRKWDGAPDLFSWPAAVCAPSLGPPRRSPSWLRVSELGGGSGVRGAPETPTFLLTRAHARVRCGSAPGGPVNLLCEENSTTLSSEETQLPSVILKLGSTSEKTEVGGKVLLFRDLRAADGVLSCLAHGHVVGSERLCLWSVSERRRWLSASFRSTLTEAHRQRTNLWWPAEREG